MMGDRRSRYASPRPVAEQSFAFPIGLVAASLALVSGLCPEAGAVRRRVSWYAPAGALLAEISYTVRPIAAGQVVVWLRYEVAGRTIEDLIPATTTRPHYGGSRFWWLCPSCGARVGVLYRPPPASTWRCRRCYAITYTSSNQSHRYDALWRRVERLLAHAK